MSNTYVFELDMTCEGCANTARKVLAKLGGDVSKVDVDLPSKKITVTTTLPSDTILQTLQKTGKACKLIS